MILTDLFDCTKNKQWSYARQCGVKHAVLKLPEDKNFDVSDISHFQSVTKEIYSEGFTPLVIEPVPPSIYQPIKCGYKNRDECIDKFIKMLSILNKFNITTLCANFMAHIGWTRTSENINERGAFVTGFNNDNFNEETTHISEEELWNNYEYFIKAVIYYAEKYQIKIALHPDDPPIKKLGNTSRIFTSVENIKRAINTVKSDFLGVTFCQATFSLMQQDVYSLVPQFKDKIFFVHFRNVTGNRYNFRETFHDSGSIDMAKIMRTYKQSNLSVPIRVDHVPTYPDESSGIAGYGAIGRLYAIGYLKGILEALK